MSKAAEEQARPQGTGPEVAPMVQADMRAMPLTVTYDTDRAIYHAILGMLGTLAPEVHPDSSLGGRALVVQDLQARVELGERRYGERLRCHNGRDAKLDLYQELLDASLYCRQVLAEGKING